MSRKRMQQPSDSRFEMTPEEEAERYGRGVDWYMKYVSPFYMQWPSTAALEPELRARAEELSRDDIEMLLSKHWRLQVMGAWYAVLANDASLLGPLLASLHRCGGGLTATELCSAVVVYADDTTVDALRAYRRRDDLIEGYSALREVTAAIAYLGGPDDGYNVDQRCAGWLADRIRVAKILQQPYDPPATPRAGWFRRRG